MRCPHSLKVSASPTTCSQCAGIEVVRLPSRFVDWRDDASAIDAERMKRVAATVARVNAEKSSALLAAHGRLARERN